MKKSELLHRWNSVNNVILTWLILYNHCTSIASCSQHTSLIYIVLCRRTDVCMCICCFSLFASLILTSITLENPQSSFTKFTMPMLAMSQVKPEQSQITSLLITTVQNIPSFCFHFLHHTSNKLLKLTNEGNSGRGLQDTWTTTSNYHKHSIHQFI